MLLVFINLPSNVRGRIHDVYGYARSLIVGARERFLIFLRPATDLPRGPRLELNLARLGTDPVFRTSQIVSALEDHRPCLVAMEAQ